MKPGKVKQIRQEKQWETHRAHLCLSSKHIKLLCPWDCPAPTRKQGAFHAYSLTGQLTNILWAVTLYDLSKLQVASNHRHLVGCLVGIVECITFTAAKQKQTCTTLLAVHSTNVQWGVTRRVSCIHVCSVEQKLFKVLDQSIPTCLYTSLISETLWHKCICSDFYFAVIWVMTSCCNVVWHLHLQGNVNCM